MSVGTGAQSSKKQNQEINRTPPNSFLIRSQTNLLFEPEAVAVGSVG